MIFKIDAHNASFLTREELTASQWNEKLDRFIDVTSFINDNELINTLILEYHLNNDQVAEVQHLLSNEKIRYFRIYCSKYEHFSLEPVYLDIKNTKGKLIYWQDWDYVFQQIDNDYFLWCFLGGIADIQREIKLSEEHIRKYREIGLAQIDYLIHDLKKLNDSTEYENAIKENRKVL